MFGFAASSAEVPPDPELGAAAEAHAQLVRIISIIMTIITVIVVQIIIIIVILVIIVIIMLILTDMISHAAQATARPSIATTRRLDPPRPC